MSHLPRPPEAVIFDMDGLILDSETLYRRAIIAAATEAGLPIGPSIYEAMIGQPWPNIARLLRDHYGADFDVEGFRTAWLDQLERLAARELRLKAGVLALLDRLDHLALPRAICTSSAYHQVRDHLAPFAILHRFDAVIAAGDYAAGKPAPDPYLAAAERLAVAPHLCLALEDSHNGIRSAHAAGMMAVMVPDLLAPSPEIRRLATLILPDLHACCTLLSHPRRA